MRRAKEEEERERRRSSSRGREGERELHAAAVDFQNWVTQSPRRPRESERASERARSERSSQLPAPREERESAAAATATSSPPPLLLSPPVPSARRSPPKKQVSLFHFLAAGEGGRTNEERTNEPPMIVLHDATPTNVRRTPKMALCGAAGASQDKLAKRGKTYLRQFSIQPFSPPPYRQKLSLCYVEVEHCAELIPLSFSATS